MRIVLIVAAGTQAIKAPLEPGPGRGCKNTQPVTHPVQKKKKKKKPARFEVGAQP